MRRFEGWHIYQKEDFAPRQWHIRWAAFSLATAAIAQLDLQPALMSIGLPHVCGPGCQIQVEKRRTKRRERIWLEHPRLAPFWSSGKPTLH